MIYNPTYAGIFDRLVSRLFALALAEFRSPRDKTETLRDQPIEDFSYIWPPGPYNILTWSTPSLWPLDYFDSDSTDMRRRKLSKDHDGGSDPVRTSRNRHDHAREREIGNWRRKLSKHHDGGSDPERTLRHGHDHAREWEIGNRRWKHSKDHDGGSDPARTLRHRHDHAREQEIGNRRWKLELTR